MNIAAIIVGIDGWEKYTLPLVQSLEEYEPSCEIVVVDNNSAIPYPYRRGLVREESRRCYSSAINLGKLYIGNAFDWYIVLSNDVLCTGPFHDILAEYDGSDVVGPLLLETPIPGIGMVPYIEGWCVACPRQAWDAIGGWDEDYIMSSFEDVGFSQSAREKGFGLIEDKLLPFVHLDQKQRFGLPGYAGSEAHNMAHFMAKHGQKVTA